MSAASSSSTLNYAPRQGPLQCPIVPLPDFLSRVIDQARLTSAYIPVALQNNTVVNDGTWQLQSYDIRETSAAYNGCFLMGLKIDAMSSDLFKSATLTIGGTIVATTTTLSCTKDCDGRKHHYIDFVRNDDSKANKVENNHLLWIPTWNCSYHDIRVYLNHTSNHLQSGMPKIWAIYWQVPGVGHGPHHNHTYLNSMEYDTTRYDIEDWKIGKRYILSNREDIIDLGEIRSDPDAPAPSTKVVLLEKKLMALLQESALTEEERVNAIDHLEFNLKWKVNPRT
jgi:hypothetical protein